MRLSTRFAVAMVVLSLLTAATVGYLAYGNIQRAVYADVSGRLESRARLHAGSLNAHLRNARQDVQALSAMSAIDGYIRTRQAGGTDPADKATKEPVWLDRIVRNFISQLDAKPEYASLRLIDAAGREVIKVDRLGQNGAIRSAPGRELVNRSDRIYFKNSIRLPQGSLYVSAMELDAEGGAEAGHVPTVRIAAPVWDGSGRTFGIVLLNIDMRPALADLGRDPPAGGAVYLINDSGDYLRHPDSSRAFGFNLGRRYFLQEEFPDMAPLVSSRTLVSREVNNAEGKSFIVTLLPLDLAGSPHVAVVEALSSEEAMTAASGVARATLLGGTMAVLLATVLAVVLARSLGRPLTQLAAQFDRFTGEEAIEAPVTAGGEIGVLARAFARMMDVVRQKQSALQDEIEQRRRAEAAVVRLNERERLLLAAVENANDAILTAAPDGTIITWNRGGERLFGYTSDEAIGQHISLIVAPEHTGTSNDYLKRLRQGERLENIETVGRAKDGSLLDTLVTLSPVLGPRGDFIATSAIFRDMTPRRQAEERFRLALEASPSAMILSDRNGIIAMVNGEAERMFGYDPGELKGKPIEILIPPQLRAGHEQNREDFALEPQRRTMGAGRDLFALRKDGSSFAVQVGLNPIQTRQGMMVMAAIVDITVRQRYEKALAERALDLQRSNAELEQFAYVASHDLQEPLRMVASYAELLAERYHGKLDAKADKYIQYAVEGAKRMQRLVNDLLAYSRVGSKEQAARMTDMNEIVAAALSSLKHAIDESEAQIEIGEMPTVIADDRQIGQVFQNLIGNALKFRSKDRPCKIRIQATDTPEGWQFSVEDNGIGIDPQYSERIFQMFQRLHDRSSYEGNGIGLTIAKKIVERHGGRIWMTSVPGKGTTFFFTLRQLREEAA